jgi:pyruvate kinase
MKRTKIICTIGPASEDKKVLEEMALSGMNVARLNMSHGTYDNHAKLIKTIREVERETGRRITLLQDLQGPKIRVGEVPAEGLDLEAGKKYVFSVGAEKYQKNAIPLPNRELRGSLKAGERVLFDDGLIDGVIYAVDHEKVEIEIKTGGKLFSHKGMNLPDSALKISALTEKDKEDLKFGIKQGVHWVALSFVRDATDVFELRELIGGNPQKIIVKVEKGEAIKNFSAILKATDAVMVARGDLGVETPAEEVPIRQKAMIEACLGAGKPVVVATQMLDSMIRNPRPTRAEVSDIANAVIDHADAVMLSGESASGKYPVEAVRMMAKTIEETEASKYDDLIPSYTFRAGPNLREEMLSELAAVLQAHSDIKAVITGALSGETARNIARLRPEVDILVACHREEKAYELNLSWGVIPFVIKNIAAVDDFSKALIAEVKKQKLLANHEEALVILKDKEKIYLQLVK